MSYRHYPKLPYALLKTSSLLWFQQLTWIFCRTAVTLMKRFCRENPVERIGYQKDGVADIKKHRWFQVKK